MNDCIKNLDIPPAKLPIFTTLFGAYSVLIDRIRQFIVWGTFFAVILMFFYIIGGQNALCINRFYREMHFCTDSWILFGIIHLLAFFIICMFMRNWYLIALRGQPADWKKILTPQMADFKIAGLLLIFFLSFAIACASIYLLYVRIPNPNWKIELCYFAIVSSGFLIPLWAVRFVSYVAFAAENQPLPHPIVIWKKTVGKTFLILSSLFILIMMGLFFSQLLIRGFLFEKNVNQLYAIIGSEYLSDITLIFVAACFMNYCYLQKGFLFERNKHENA